MKENKNKSQKILKWNFYRERVAALLCCFPIDVQLWVSERECRTEWGRRALGQLDGRRNKSKIKRGEGRSALCSPVQKQLRNYEFPPRVWLLKESNRSPLDTQLFCPFSSSSFYFDREKKKYSHRRRRHQCHRRPNRAHRSLENFQTTACK